MRIAACSTNPGKLREFALAAQECGRTDIVIEVLSGLKQISPPEEDGKTFEENATKKAIYYSRFSNELVLADDSGLEVDALNGAPGVYSARYAGPGASDEDNNNLLLRDLGTASHRDARFVCVLALAQKEQMLLTTRGVVEGQILISPRGENGFGYDPLFFYPQLGRSFAELSPEEKFSVSHRGKALRLLFERFKAPSHA